MFHFKKNKTNIKVNINNNFEEEIYFNNNEICGIKIDELQQVVTGFFPLNIKSFNVELEAENVLNKTINYVHKALATKISSIDDINKLKILILKNLNNIIIEKSNQIVGLKSTVLNHSLIKEQLIMNKVNNLNNIDLNAMNIEYERRVNETNSLKNAKFDAAGNPILKNRRKQYDLIYQEIEKDK